MPMTQPIIRRGVGGIIKSAFHPIVEKPWTPDVLFAAAGATKVFWADLTKCKMWQDSAGTVEAGLGDPVGLIENQSNIGGIKVFQDVSGYKIAKHATYGIYGAGTKNPAYRVKTTAGDNFTKMVVGCGVSTMLTASSNSTSVYAALLKSNDYNSQSLVHAASLLYGVFSYFNSYPSGRDKGPITKEVNGFAISTKQPSTPGEGYCITMNGELVYKDTSNAYLGAGNMCFGATWVTMNDLSFTRLVVADKYLSPDAMIRLSKWLETGV